MKELHSELQSALECGEAQQKELNGLRTKAKELEECRKVAADAEARATAATEVARTAELRATSAQAAAEESANAVEDLRRAVAESQSQEALWRRRFTEERSLRQALGRKITDLQGNIRVICRIRPLSTTEEADGSAVEVIDSENLQVQDLKHTFDYVFGPDSSQEAVFSEVQPTVVSALNGFNVSVLVLRPWPCKPSPDNMIYT